MVFIATLYCASRLTLISHYFSWETLIDYVFGVINRCQNWWLTTFFRKYPSRNQFSLWTENSRAWRNFARFCGMCPWLELLQLISNEPPVQYGENGKPRVLKMAEVEDYLFGPSFYRWTSWVPLAGRPVFQNYGGE